ncbi:MAG: TraB/GumN family protein [Gammaproteobacteria bacterium]
MQLRAHRAWAVLWLAIASAPVVGADGLVWAIEGPRNTVYLAGSVHLLRQTDATLPAAFDRAYADAETILMELDLDDFDPAQAGRWMLERGVYTDGSTLRETLGEPRHRRVAAAANELGLPIEGVQQFEPWAVALTLVELAYARLGFDPESGVERQIERRARRDGKEIRGLETPEEQLGLLDALPLEDQRRFLEQTVEELGELEKDTDELLTAWRTGDALRLATMLATEYDEFPSLYRALVTERNARWMPQIERLLQDDNDYLIVVGVLHLVGDDGLVALARRRGLDAERIR